MNLNTVCLTGNLTRDPELRTTGSGTSVCSLRIAVNERTKIDGEWRDKPMYFDVTIWAGQGENAAKYLSKGRPVAIQGRLQHREWQTKDGDKRQTVDIVAERVQFLGAKGDDDDDDRGRFSAQGDVPVDTGDFEPAPPSSRVGDDSDDIPF